MATDPLYTTQQQRGGGQCAAWVPSAAAPQRPTRLAPRLGTPQADTSGCAHLWSCDGGLLRCYHCGWTYRAVLARAQAGGGTPGPGRQPYAMD